MTIASFFSRHRARVLLLCALTLLLHFLTIDWLGGHIGPIRTAPPPPPSIITAQLHLAAPDPAAMTATPFPAPKPAPKPAARPAVKAAPKPLAKPDSKPDSEPDSEPDPLTDLPAPDPQASAPVPAAVAGDSDAAAPAAPAMPAMPAAAPKLASVPAPAAAAAPAAAGDAAKPPEPGVAAAHRYNVNLPAPAELELDVKRVDADGTQWNGEGVISWQNDGSHYKVTEEVGISVLITRVNLLVQTSDGDIDDNGIAPVTATEKRKGRALTATHFNRDTGQITFSASERVYPLPPGAQDKASVPFQLAGIGRADVNQFAGNVDIFVGEDKEANLFRFVLVGEDELDLGKLGRVVTWHLTRPPRPGTYSSTLDIWLAPSLGWYPVQIRNTEASGALTTQTVSKITDSSRR